MCPRLQLVDQVRDIFRRVRVARHESIDRRHDNERQDHREHDAEKHDRANRLT